MPLHSVPPPPPPETHAHAHTRTHTHPHTHAHTPPPLLTGEDVLAKVAAQGTGKGHPRQLVEVTACGQLPATRTIDAKA